MSNLRKLGALVAAGAMVMALAGTASGVTKWATPDDWYDSSNDAQGENSNSPEFWEAWFDLDEGDCAKVEGAGLDAVMNDDGSASLGVAYDYVIVKQANPNAKDIDFDNTIFEDVAADETVFADTDGDGAYTDADSGGISHIIVCSPTETTTTTEETTTTTEETTTTTEETTTTTEETTTTTEETTTTTTFTQDTGGETDEPTLPPTSTVGGGSSGPSEGSWLLVAALGAFLAGAVILTPARAKSQR